jgi:hypothetical protein
LVRKYVLTVLVVLLGSGTASARSHHGFLEVAGGGHVPLLGQRYQEMFGPGTVLGLRGGAFHLSQPGARHAFALEFGFDWVRLSDDVRDRPDRSYDFDEYRCLFGGRYLFFARPELHFYARAVGGVEVLAEGGVNRIGKVRAEASGTNAGAAAELSLGSSWRLGSFNLGVELAVPWSEHRDDGLLGQGMSTGYQALSVDVLLTVSTRR